MKHNFSNQVPSSNLLNFNPKANPVRPKILNLEYQNPKYKKENQDKHSINKMLDGVQLKLNEMTKTFLNEDNNNYNIKKSAENKATVRPSSMQRPKNYLPLTVSNEKNNKLYVPQMKNLTENLENFQTDIAEYMPAEYEKKKHYANRFSDINELNDLDSKTSYKNDNKFDKYKLNIYDNENKFNKFTKLDNLNKKFPNFEDNICKTQPNLFKKDLERSKRTTKADKTKFKLLDDDEENSLRRDSNKKNKSFLEGENHLVRNNIRKEMDLLKNQTEPQKIKTGRKADAPKYFNKNDFMKKFSGKTTPSLPTSKIIATGNKNYLDESVSSTDLDNIAKSLADNNENNNLINNNGPILPMNTLDEDEINNNINNNLNNINNGNYTQKYLEYQNIIPKLSAEIDSLRLENTKLLSEKTKLSSELFDRNQRVNMYKVEVKELRSLLEKKDELIKFLKNEKIKNDSLSYTKLDEEQKYIEENNQLKAEIKKIQRKMRLEQNEEIIKIQNENIGLSKKISELNQLVKDFNEKKIENLELFKKNDLEKSKQIQELNIKINLLEKEKLNMKDQIKNSLFEMGKLKEDNVLLVNQLEKERDNVQKLNEINNINMNKLNNMNNNLNQQHKILNEEDDYLYYGPEELDNSDKKEQVSNEQSLNKYIEAVLEENKKLKDNLLTIEQNYRKTEEENENLKNYLKMSEEKIENLEKNKTNENNNLLNNNNSGSNNIEEINNLNNSLKDYEKINKNLLTQNENLKQELNNNKTEIEQKKTLLNQMNLKIKNLEKELKNLKETFIENGEKNQNELEIQLEELRQKAEMFDSVKKENSKILIENKSLQSQLKKLKLTTKKSENEIDLLQNSNSENKKEKNELVQKLNTMNAKLEESNKNIAELNESISKLTNQKNELLNENLKLSKKKENLEATNNNLNLEIKNLRNKINDLKNESKKLDKLDRDSSKASGDFFSPISTGNIELNKILQEKQNLMEENDNLKEELVNLQKQSTELKKAIDDIIKERNEYKNQVNEMKEKLENKDKDSPLKNLSKKYSNSLEEIESGENYQKIKKEYDTLMKELKNQQDKNIQLMDQVQTKEDQIEKLTDIINNLKTIPENMSEDYQTPKEKKLKKKEGSALNNKNTENNGGENIIDHEHEPDYETLLINLEDAKNELIKMQEEKEEFMNENQAIVDENEELKQEMEDVKNEYDQLKLENENLKEQFEEINMKYLEQQKIAETFKDINSKIVQDNANKKGQLVNLENIQQENESVWLTVNNLKQLVNEKELEIKNLNEENERLKFKLMQNEDNNNEIENNFNQIQNKLQNSFDPKLNKSDRIDRRNSNNQSFVDSNNNNTRYSVGGMTDHEKLEKAKEKLREYKEELNAQDEQIKHLKLDIKNLRKQIKDIESFQGRIADFDKFINLFLVAFEGYKPKKKEQQEAYKLLGTHFIGIENILQKKGKNMGKIFG